MVDELEKARALAAEVLGSDSRAAKRCRGLKMAVATARTRKTRERAKADRALTLAELQDRFQEAVVAGDDALLALIPDNSRTTRNVLLRRLPARLRGAPRRGRGQRLSASQDVYGRPRHSTKCCAAMLPCARRGIPMCAGSGGACRSICRRWHRYADHPALRELAQIERALNDAFDAVDAPVLGLEDLARHSPERWGDLSFLAAAFCSAARSLDERLRHLACAQGRRGGTSPPSRSRGARTARRLAQ